MNILLIVALFVAAIYTAGLVRDGQKYRNCKCKQKRLREQQELAKQIQTQDKNVLQRLADSIK